MTNYHGPIPSNIGAMQQPMDQSPAPYNGAGNLPNYPPPPVDEARLTAILERLEHKLDTIFAKLQQIELSRKPWL